MVHRFVAGAFLLALFAASWIGAIAAEESSQDVVRHSDIDMVSWYPPGQHTEDPEDFRKWGATLVTWGLDHIFTRTANVPEGLDVLVEAAHKGGVRAYLANLDMCSAQPWNLARDPELREAVARDFDGNGLVVPWFPAVVDGVPAYAGCINNPVYRENVRQRVREAAAAGCKGLHVDCANGLSGVMSRHGGCFCSYCMDGFKQYLEKKYTPQQLAELGIADLEIWDFARTVKQETGTKQGLLEAMKGGKIYDRLPVYRDYQRFLSESSVNWLVELRQLAKELGGPDAGYSINAGSIERWIALRDIADFFTCEIRHNPEEGRIPPGVVGKYRAAESLGKILSVTAGTVGDWHYPAQGGMDKLVAMWVALAYANGHLFIVPNNVWCFSEEKGAHAYVGPEDIFVPLYRFIHDNAELLDGYAPVEQVGVLYRPGGPVITTDEAGQSRRRWEDPFSDICGAILDSQIPFSVVIPGGIGGVHGISEQTQGTFERVVIPPGLEVRGKEAEILDTWKREGFAVPWTGNLDNLAPLITVSEGTHIWVFPRAKDGDPNAPFVCHLLNQTYDANRDSMIPQKNIELSLRADPLGRNFRKAVLRAVGEAPRELPLTEAGGRIRLEIPELVSWSILSLEY